MRSAAFAIILGLGSVAAAQDIRVAATNQPLRVRYDLSWVPVFPGTTTPTGNQSGFLHYLEAVHLKLTVQLLDPVGTPVVWTPPAVGGSGAGELRGLFSVFFDVVGSGASTLGSWSHLQIPPAWDLVGPPGWGTPALGGSRLNSIQAGQFPLNQGAVLPTNPVVEIWSGVWTPVSPLSPGTRQFTMTVGTGNPRAFASSVIVRDPTLPNLVLAGTAADEFTTVTLITIPAPASGALVVMGMVGLGRRRR